MSSIWNTSVSQTMHIAQEALRALVPIVEKARMKWREPDNYDDWDLIASAIVRSIVSMSVENCLEFARASPIIDYDMRADNYSQFSFITDLASAKSLAFVSFVTDREPFDACLFAELDENQRVLGELRRAFNEVDWGVAARHGTSLDKLRSLTVEL